MIATPAVLDTSFNGSMFFDSLVKEQEFCISCSDTLNSEGICTTCIVLSDDDDSHYSDPLVYVDEEYFDDLDDVDQNLIRPSYEYDDEY